MTLTILSHPACAAHDPGEPYPDRPVRLTAIEDQLLMSGLAQVVLREDAPRATRAQLDRAHDTNYVAAVHVVAPRQGRVMLDDDTPMLPESLPAALHAAGAAVRGVDLVMAGGGPVFCAVRPPGHHAEADRAMGFCFFNNVAVAARHALDHHGLERVAVLDFDVHHGNGTEAILGDDERVLFCSSFQHPFYPWTGDAERGPRYVAVPLPEGTGGAAFRAAIAAAWWPALDAFRPQLILLSAGFDGHALDPMAGLELVEADYAWLTEEVMRRAEIHAERRVVSVLEGGYHPGATARSVVAHLKAML